MAIEELFSSDLDITMVNAFRNAMDLRQEADYGLKFSQEGSIETIENADLFLSKAKEILKIK
ncbi:MAG: hypothetical protein ACREBB_07710 [Nitrosotalea sp.]